MNFVMAPLSLLAWIVLSSGRLLDAAEPAAPQESGVLHLANGSFVSGRLVDSETADVATWQGTDFTTPFQFPVSQVHSVVYPQPAELPQPQGEFCFELAGGGLLFGSLRGISDELVDIEEARLGRLSLRRERLHRFFRWNSGSDLIYAGPTGLQGWTVSNSQPSWREEGGQLVTDQPEAQLTGDFKIPAQAAVELELSWTNRPNFSLALGVEGSPESIPQAFRLEVVDGELVVLRETPRAADIAAVTPVGPTEGHIHLLIYIDQQRGELLVYSMTGVRLAELHVTEAKPRTGGGLALTNLQGDIRLERLRISRWNGVAPTNSSGSQPRFLQADGGTRAGRLTAFDPQQGMLTFRTGDQDASIPLRNVDDVLLSPPVVADPETPEPTRNLHLIYQDGSRLSGLLSKMGAGTIELKCPEIVQPVAAPVNGLRGITLLTVQTFSAAELPHRAMLELQGTKLRGRLTDGRAQPDASCLTWQPEYSTVASPLQPGAAGRIVYRVPARTVKVSNAANRNRPQAVRMLNLGQVLADQPVARAPSKGLPKDQKFLHLRSGDTIPCEVKSIDERGVTFETPLSDATFVSHEKIKAVELTKTSSSLKLSPQKQERLLTLPRLQRESPPWQLICSRNGDLLRGRILGLSDTQLTVEVRLDQRRLDRERVAQIIWLHQDELTDESKVAPAAKGTPAVRPPEFPATRVQVQRSDGIRLTYFANHLEDTLLSGRSDVLGECRTDLTQVDQLLIGSAIEQSLVDSPYHRWKLHHAIDPKFVAEENGEADSGQESPLVGKPAPDFKLEFLDGTKFHLGDCRGQVVVLDFWATWCGPCLQVMPQIEQVAGEFREANIRLVAVNLEESPQQIRKTLERHKIDVPVVLDQDGVVAHRYQATAIPQTVVIDRAGKVFRVFVGGGPDYADQLRSALKLVTKDQPPGEGSSKTSPPDLSEDSQPPRANP